MKLNKIICPLLIVILILTIIPINTNATTLREFEEQVNKYQNELNDKNNEITASKKQLFNFR